MLNHTSLGRIDNRQSTIENRSGYTLLEVLLASAIGVLLMAALYVAMDVQLRHAQAGRDVVEQSLLVRALLARMGNDIASNLGPVAPDRSRSSGGGAAGGGTSQPASSGTTPSGGGSGNSSTSTPSSSAGTTSVNGPVQFNLGVQGDANRLTLFTSRVPRELNFRATGAADGQGQPVVSDLRRITYWLAGGNDNPLGLARQEVLLVTSDDATASVPPDIPDEASHIVAEEVKSLQFRYFDGSTWVDGDTWDGTQVGADGVTPIGPPVAIEITIGVLSPASGNRDGGERQLKMYRHVVAIPTANGQSQTSSGGATP